MSKARNVPAATAEIDSPLERQFYGLLRVYLPQYAARALWQVTYAKPRRAFVADFGWPSCHVLVDCQGGIFNRKAHGSVSGILRDIARLNWAAACGYVLLRFSDQEARQPEEFFALLKETLER